MDKFESLSSRDLYLRLVALFCLAMEEAVLANEPLQSLDWYILSLNPRVVYVF